MMYAWDQTLEMGLATQVKNAQTRAGLALDHVLTDSVSVVHL